MNGSSPKRRGTTMNRTSPFLISLILIFSCFPVVFVSANAESTTISTFSGGFATVDVDLDGGVMDNSSSIDVPRNVTLSEAPSHGLPAIIYDLKCSGSQAYIALAKEFLERSNTNGGK